MNRQTKRMMQRQGQLGPDGSPAVTRRPPQQARPAPPPEAGPRRARTLSFLKDVRAELRKVAWPTRAEVVNYSTVVLVTLVILVALIFVLDFLFAKAVLFLLET